MNNQHNDTELEKFKSHIILQILEYVPNSVLTRTIMKKTTGNITICAVDEGEELAEKTLAFDSFVQVIDGVADVIIKGKKFTLAFGEGIIIPAHSSHCIEAATRFKMISTIIKSGYED